MSLSRPALGALGMGKSMIGLRTVGQEDKAFAAGKSMTGLRTVGQEEKGPEAGKSMTGIKTVGQQQKSPSTAAPLGNASSDDMMAMMGDQMPPLSAIDQFIPWICKMMCVTELVIVTKVVQEDYLSYAKKKKIRKSKAVVETSELVKQPSRHTSVDDTDKIAQTQQKNFIFGGCIIPLKVFVDIYGKVVELSIKDCDCISQRFIKAVFIIIPMHKSLAKLTINGCALKQETVYEIGKHLPFSTITDVCLDHTSVRQSNYYVLLDYNSKLKRLSLNRCRINDLVLEEILKRLQNDSNVSKTLQILELSCNLITDLGAGMLANTLKRNRSLLHLNIAGNRITNEGAILIFDKLMSFRLTDEDIVDKSKRKRAYFSAKAKVFARCYQEQLKNKHKLEEFMQSPGGHRKSVSASSKAPLKALKSKIRPLDLNEIAENLAVELMGGPFTDPYDDKHLTFGHDSTYCTGNFKLCSLNFAYNHLDYFSLAKVLEVVKYQYSIDRAPDETGLLRLILDGNYIPESCFKLDCIDEYLRKAVYDRTPDKKDRKKRDSTVTF